MARKTIYIRDDDLPLWDRAEELAEGSLSGFLTRAVRDFVTAKEAEMMASMTVEHGQVTKRILNVWASRDDEGSTAWGTSFDTKGTGPHQAAALVRVMQNDPQVKQIEMEERRVYADGWVDRQVLKRFVRRADGWSVVES